MRTSFRFVSRSCQSFFCVVTVFGVGVSTAFAADPDTVGLRPDARLLAFTSNWKAVVTSLTDDGKSRVIEWWI